MCATGRSSSIFVTTDAFCSAPGFRFDAERNPDLEASPVVTCKCKPIVFGRAAYGRKKKEIEMSFGRRYSVDHKKKPEIEKDREIRR